ncbi:MAG: hypothetical protein CEE38_02540 [Planctomycetes bacterium B3_Pla]|nr:MAG: hypothetical protein CEE38_02540 [Planctomycetes bacterium B3_Pla]
MNTKIQKVILMGLCCFIAVSVGAPIDYTKIQDGTILDSAGNPITVGYDQWGYNYQAHIFNGYYWNFQRPNPPVTEGDVVLQMKWNDAWLANTSRDGDNLLDRHYGFDEYIGSGAWLTNHMVSTNDDGVVWTYFVKIIAVTDTDTPIDGIWYNADGIEIGPVIWGSFAIIQEVGSETDPSSHGLQYVSPGNAGLGNL